MCCISLENVPFCGVNGEMGFSKPDIAEVVVPEAVNGGGFKNAVAASFGMAAAAAAAAGAVAGGFIVLEPDVTSKKGCLKSAKAVANGGDLRISLRP